jgi:signal transduction histidine kinase
VVFMDDTYAASGPQRMALADIIALLRDEVGPPMQRLVSALSQLPQSSAGDGVGDAADQLRERLRRLGDLVAVFGDEVMRTDDRVEIGELLKSVCAELAPKARTRRVRFDIEEPSQTLPPLYGNMTMIRRAFYECIDNAVINSRREVSSQQDLEVKLSCRLTGEHVLISVRNQGALPSEMVGVETRDLFRLQSKDNATTGGARIGLPLVHRVVGLHGGNMRISAVGDDEVRVLMEFPTGAPQRAQSQLDIAQIQRYATDLAQLMSRRKKESV